MDQGFPWADMEWKAVDGLSYQLEHHEAAKALDNPTKLLETTEVTIHGVLCPEECHRVGEVASWKSCMWAWINWAGHFMNLCLRPRQGKVHVSSYWHQGWQRPESSPKIVTPNLLREGGVGETVNWLRFSFLFLGELGFQNKKLRSVLGEDLDCWHPFG